MPDVAIPYTTGLENLPFFSDSKETDKSVFPQKILNWFSNIHLKKSLYHDFRKGDDHIQKLYYYLLLWSFACDFFKCEEKLKWLGEEWLSKDYYRQFLSLKEDNTTSSIETTELFSFDLPKSKTISWDQARKLAFSSLKDAEERRLKFAEEEAKLIAVWEE